MIDAHRPLEISVGDYVLSGGEPAAMVVLDAIVRLLPGVLGNAATVGEESFTAGLLEYPHYTRPADWIDATGTERRVPEVLLSGHHGNIAKWRREQAEAITAERRPDLLNNRHPELVSGPIFRVPPVHGPDIRQDDGLNSYIEIANAFAYKTPSPGPRSRQS